MSALNDALITVLQATKKGGLVHTYFSSNERGFQPKTPGHGGGHHQTP